MIATAGLEKTQRYQIFAEDHREALRAAVRSIVVRGSAFDMIRRPPRRDGKAGE
jgi:hypothetical protein